MGTSTHRALPDKHSGLHCQCEQGFSASDHLTVGVSAAAAECEKETAHRKDVFTSAEHKLYLKTVVVNIFDLQAHKVNGFCFPPLHYGQD